MVDWNDVKRTLTIHKDVTDNFDIGFYDLSIKVYDNFDTVEIDGYVECKDRVFATESLKNRCQDRVRGETTYNIKMEVRRKTEVG
jgi:hypothetical protein